MCGNCEIRQFQWLTNCSESLAGICNEYQLHPMNLKTTLTEFPAMQLDSKKSRITTTSASQVQAKWIAMALPLAITIGCAGPIIDYTVSDAEYTALTTPAPAAPVAETAVESLAQATTDEPVLAAATPAAESPASVAEEKPAIIPAETKATEVMFTEKTMAAKEAMAAKESMIAKEAMLAEEAAAAKEAMLAEETAAKLAMLAEETAAAKELAIVESELTEQKVAELNTKVAQLEANQLEALATASQEPELGAAISIDRLGFSPSVYTTAGIGVSRSDPNTSAVAGFSTDDKIEAAGQVAVGVDVARFLSFEAHSADLGSSSLSPEGRINTHVQGVSALIYAGRNTDRFGRRGLNGYARIGFNQIEQSPIGNIPFTERTSNHASFGVGAEYVTRSGLGFRADVVAFDDSDLQYGQFGVLYRLGSKPRILPKLAADTPIPTPIPKVEQVSFSESKTGKSAFEPKLAAAKPKNSSAVEACLQLNGVLSNVNFRRGSAQLNHNSATALNEVAKTLAACGNRQIIISAHTDNNGLAADNHELSKKRARVVAIHLAGRGIDRNYIRAVAYGESQPVASNATPEGRNRNRRVELEVR